MEQNTFFRKIRNLRWQTSELQNITFCQSQTYWDTLYQISNYIPSIGAKNEPKAKLK